MRRLLLPFFIARLVISLVPFLVVAVTTLLSPFRSFLITLFFFVYFLLVLSKSMTQKPSPVVTVLNAELETELTKWQALYEQQPTHRDVLINMARLYSAMGDENNARKYVKKAQAIDPNNEITL
ncbi:MAG TPA: tetratricopeptide repeat protein [Patescibacteria group bacterium]